MMGGSLSRIWSVDFWHFRCMYGRKDIELLAKEIMEVDVTAQIIESIHFNCNGNLRKAMKLMYIMEGRIRQNPHFTLDSAVMEMEL